MLFSVENAATFEKRDGDPLSEADEPQSSNQKFHKPESIGFVYFYETEICKRNHTHRKPKYIAGVRINPQKLR